MFVIFLIIRLPLELLLCNDQVYSDVPPHLVQPCYVTLGQALIQMRHNHQYGLSLELGSNRIQRDSNPHFSYYLNVSRTHCHLNYCSSVMCCIFRPANCMRNTPLLVKIIFFWFKTSFFNLFLSLTEEKERKKKVTPQP